MRWAHMQYPPTSDSRNKIVDVWYDIHGCNAFYINIIYRAHHARRTQATLHSFLYMIVCSQKLSYQLQVTWFIYSFHKVSTHTHTHKVKLRCDWSTGTSAKERMEKQTHSHSHKHIQWITTSITAYFRMCALIFCICMTLDGYHHLDWRVKGYARHSILFIMYHSLLYLLREKKEKRKRN